jgi:hypothetical protein
MAGTTSRDPPSGLRPAWTARVSIFIVNQDISSASLPQICVERRRSEISDE